MKEQIVIRKLFPAMTKLLSLVGLFVSIWGFHDNLVLLILSISVILAIAFLSDLNYTIRRTGEHIDLGYSIMGFFYPKQQIVGSELKGLKIQQDVNRNYQIGFLTKSDVFFALDKRPTLDKSEELKNEIEKKIIKNWSQQWRA